MKRVVRAAAHVHSDWSYDGRWPLEKLAAAFGRRGFQAVLMTEHDRGFDEQRWQAYRQACAAAISQRVVLVPGIEYSDPSNRIHILVWGVERFLGEGLDTGDVLRLVQEHDGVAVLAHPQRRDVWHSWQSEWSELLAGIEIWSRKYDGWAPSAGAAELLAATPTAVPFVGLDFHTSRQFFPLSMRIDLTGPRTSDGVVEALRAHRAAPRLLGLDATRLLSGPAHVAARSAERIRRPVYRHLRRVVASGQLKRMRRR